MLETKEAVKRQLLKLASAPLSLQVYRESAISHLREAVPFAAACFTSVDPNTLLSTGASTEAAVEAIHHQLFEYEYLHKDFNSYEQLVQAITPAATLSEETGGQLERSGRYRAVLLPAGFGDELRAALLCEDACWGFLTLFRKADEPLFHMQERMFIASIAPLLAKSLKKISLALPLTDANGMMEEPGILVLSGQLTIMASNQAAHHWLSALRNMEQVDDDILPRPIRAVCSRALAQAGTGARAKEKWAKVCIRLPDGRYLSIRASKLEDILGTIQLAVALEAAKPSDILPLIAEAYGLTAREKQILERIIRGFSTKELARSLHISAYTVQDHLKSIFAKTGFSSRRELMWELFSRHSLG
ncbi:helix-turn-helix domain-containing protein [Paenibacillus sp. PL91]|uniref:helix-turn-helix domain-containing protein n=1 Tax=Paenibacillus sp. PL91 TaxID=2729538 RepID=UPI00145F5B74|nr:helix-turn-helix transcriptional regulator [Paenibacillus sp. PL91]MBC9200261.1 LuxR family transcriptional regulator [Paenibacillus sp. PL91]